MTEAASEGSMVVNQFILKFYYNKLPYWNIELTME